MKFASKIVIFCILAGLAGCDEQEENKIQADKKQTPPESPEIVLVSMAGWTQTAETMDAIERAMVRSLAGSFPNHHVSVKRRLLGLLPEGDSELFLGLEYEAWKQRKNTPAGRDDMFIAVGHSSGATAIYSLLRNETFKDGDEAPAFLGLVDMVLPLGPHDLTGKIPRNGARQTVVIHYHSSEADSISGIRNVPVGGDHFSIVNSIAVTQGLAGGAVNACRQNTCQQNTPQKTNETTGRWESKVSSR